MIAIHQSYAEFIRTTVETILETPRVTEAATPEIINRR
jgi:hypothetical protein